VAPGHRRDHQFLGELCIGELADHVLSIKDQATGHGVALVFTQLHSARKRVAKTAALSSDSAGGAGPGARAARAMAAAPQTIRASGQRVITPRMERTRDEPSGTLSRDRPTVWEAEK
jgi:hypothetical protein